MEGILLEELLGLGGNSPDHGGDALSLVSPRQETPQFGDPRCPGDFLAADVRRSSRVLQNSRIQEEHFEAPSANQLPAEEELFLLGVHGPHEENRFIHDSPSWGIFFHNPIAPFSAAFCGIGGKFLLI
jgi:hypothetical protein